MKSERWGHTAAQESHLWNGQTPYKLCHTVLKRSITLQSTVEFFFISWKPDLYRLNFCMSYHAHVMQFLTVWKAQFWWNLFFSILNLGYLFRLQINLVCISNQISNQSVTTGVTISILKLSSKFELSTKGSSVCIALS